MELDQGNRRRLLWVLVAVTAGYGLLNVAIYYTTDSFGPVWFATSLLVYGMLLVAAVAMAFLETGPSGQRGAAPAGRLEQLGEETLYQTDTGRLVRARLRYGGQEHQLLFAIMADEVLPLETVEGRLDEVDVRVPPQRLGSEIEQALARRSAGRPDSDDDPSVEVEA